MGVYINMEMPQNHNHVTITIWSNGAASYGLHDREESLVDFRNVEVIPIPPHGRLIDADALVERIDGIWDCNDMVFKPNDKICKIPEDCKGCKWEQTKDCIQRMVENAPAIIPAEEGET